MTVAHIYSAIRVLARSLFAALPKPSARQNTATTSIDRDHKVAATMAPALHRGPGTSKSDKFASDIIARRSSNSTKWA